MDNHRCPIPHSSSAGVVTVRTMFASLSIPNYRIYFSGTLLTNMGQWMARTAQSWLVLVILTHGNAAVLGWVMAVNFAPILLVTP